jgi:hypothetical protein
MGNQCAYVSSMFVRSSKDLPNVQWLSFTPKFLRMSLSLVYSCLSMVDYTSSYFIYPPILESSSGSSLTYCLWLPFRDASWQPVSWHPNNRNRLSSVTSLMYLGNIRAEIGCQLLALGISAFLVNVLTLSVSDF